MYTHAFGKQNLCQSATTQKAEIEVKSPLPHIPGSYVKIVGISSLNSQVTELFDAWKVQLIPCQRRDAVLKAAVPLVHSASLRTPEELRRDCLPHTNRLNFASSSWNRRTVWKMRFFHLPDPCLSARFIAAPPPKAMHVSVYERGMTSINHDASFHLTSLDLVSRIMGLLLTSTKIFLSPPKRKERLRIPSSSHRFGRFF